MKRKIIIALLLLFILSTSGAVLAVLNISNTTETLSRLITLHQIEKLRQDLVISVQTVQSDLYTVRTKLGQTVDGIVENVASMNAAVATCGTCHHAPAIAERIQEVQDRMDEYQDALSHYITASAHKQRIDKLKVDAATIGNLVLERTEAMSVQAGRKLEAMTAAAMARIKNARIILFLSIALTFLFGIMVAVHLIRSVTGPVQALMKAIREVSGGNLDQTITLNDRSEFGELAQHFNAMSAALKENYEVLVEEIKERRQVEAALRESEERYAIAARGANDGLWDWDLRNNKLYYSYRWKSMLGYAEGEIGSTIQDWLGLVHPADRDKLEAKITTHISGQQAHLECEYRIRHKDGSFRWMLCRGLAVRDQDGKPYRMAGSQTDMTERRNAEEQLIHDAFHDALTGLPNRALFMDRLEHVIASARRHSSYLYAVLFLDLDRFKVINDSMGHGIGDSLLIEVSQRLRTSLRPGDTVARLGGDEFAILLENVSSVTNVEEITQRMEIALARPYQIQGHEIFTTQSIGIALKSERYEWPEQVIRDADIAMYQAKSKGRARHEFFDTAMHTSIIDRLQLEADLRSAVEHQKGFELHYQPIMDLKTRRLTGFEALVRWNHDSRGTVYPLEFIPLAEETGLIAPLSEWVLRESCRQLRVWQSKYPAQPPLMMSVNISSLVLLKTNLVDLIGSLLHDEQIAHGSLAIEVTESVLMTHTVHVMETMTRLRNLGVQIHIDDFGTGYSSLSYLHNFPVTALKIDRSFIASITGTSENKEIVKTIVALAQNLKLQVIAEGVEQHSQLTAINTLACNFGQGFFFSEPLPAEAVEAWIGPAMKHSA